MKVPVTPKLSGKIIDHDSGKPLEGAAVYFTQHPEESVLTAPDGSFDLPAVYSTYWVLPIGPIDFMPSHGTLVADVDLYQTCKVEVFGPYVKETNGCNVSFSGSFIQLELRRCP
ncbi:MAG: hypothetical protein ACLQVJ_19795 [Syntrophobacteraceae bacterium]